MVCASDQHFILSWWVTSADNLARRDGIYEEGIEAEMKLFWDKKLASVASEAEGGPGMAVVVVLVVGEVGNGRAGPLMLQKRGSRLRPTHLGRPCCPIFVVLFSTFWDNWALCRNPGGRSRLLCGVVMQFERYIWRFSQHLALHLRHSMDKVKIFPHSHGQGPNWPLRYLDVWLEFVKDFICTTYVSCLLDTGWWKWTLRAFSYRRKELTSQRAGQSFFCRCPLYPRIGQSGPPSTSRPWAGIGLDSGWRHSAKTDLGRKNLIVVISPNLTQVWVIFQGSLTLAWLSEKVIQSQCCFPMKPVESIEPEC